MFTLRRRGPPLRSWRTRIRLQPTGSGRLAAMPRFTFDLTHPDKGTRRETVIAETLESAIDEVQQAEGWSVVAQIATPAPQSAGSQSPKASKGRRLAVVDPRAIDRPGPITQAEVHSAVFWAIIKAGVVILAITGMLWLLILLLDGVA